MARTDGKSNPLPRILRGVALAAVLVFFLFPILWIFLMSFQTNETILRIPPSLAFTPTLINYVSLISGHLQTFGDSMFPPICLRKRGWTATSSKSSPSRSIPPTCSPSCAADRQPFALSL